MLRLTSRDLGFGRDPEQGPSREAAAQIVRRFDDEAQAAALASYDSADARCRRADARKRFWRDVDCFVLGAVAMYAIVTVVTWR